MEKKSKIKWLGGLGIYTLAFSVITIVILCIFAANGKSFVKFVDGAAQHFPVLCYVREYLQQILKTGIFDLPTIDFSIGQGFDIVGALNYYGFGDPLTLLTVLFPDNALEAMYAFFIFLRIYLAGVGFMVFCKEAGQKCNAAVISGSILYCFCSFAMSGGFKHPIFLNGLMYLPFLLWGIERVIKKKGILPLALVTACSFMSNYYFMYANTMLAGIYLLVRLYGHYREMGVKGFLQTVGKIILGYAWGVCLAGVILFPAVYTFLHNARSTGKFKIPLFYDWKYYGGLWKSLVNVPSSAGKWTVPGTGAVGIISMAILIVKHPKKDRRLLIATAVLGVMLSLPFFGSLMNGFAYITNRWSYGFSFLMAFTAVRMLPYIKEMTGKARHALIGATLLYCLPIFLSGIMKKERGDIRCVLIVLASLFLLLLTGWVMRRKPWRAVSYAIVFITMGGVLASFSGNKLSSPARRFAGYMQIGEVEKWMDSSSFKAMELIQDDSFYRVENHWDIYNFGLWENINPTNFYYSVVPSIMRPLCDGIWLNAQDRANVLNSLDSRTALTALASVKYYVSKEEKSIPYGYEKIGAVTDGYGIMHYLYENKNPLPMGYTYDTVVDRKEYDKLEPLEKQQILLEHAVLEEPVKGFSFSSPKIKTAITTKKVKVLKAKNVEIEDGKWKTKKRGKLVLGFEGEPDSETYLILKGIRSNDAEHDGRSVRITSEAGQTRMKLTGRKHISYIKKGGETLNLGYSQKAQTKCVISFNLKRTFKFDRMEVQCVSMKGMDQLISQRKEESLEKVVVDGNQVTGKISVSTPKILQFSIPYSKGWKASVDGKETKTFPSDIAYMGIALETGEHEILLEYTSPWSIPGRILTLAGIAGIAVYLIAGKRKKKLSKV